MRLRYTIRTDVAWRQIDGQVFAYSDDGALHRLRAASAVDLFLALERGPVGVDELVALLVERYEVEEGRARQDAESFLRVLLERQIATVAPV